MDDLNSIISRRYGSSKTRFRAVFSTAEEHIVVVEESDTGRRLEAKTAAQPSSLATKACAYVACRCFSPFNKTSSRSFGQSGDGRNDGERL